jgi:hypothetical protein
MITTLAVLGCASVHAQTFNVVNLPSNNGASRGASVREVPEGYLVFGDKFDEDLQYRVHVELHGMDGELIWQHAIVDASQSVYGYSDPVSPTLAQGGWVASVALLGLDSMSWRAYRFDAAGDTLWTRSLLSGSLLYPRAAAYQAGSFYFASLYKENPADAIKAVIARLDSAGSLIQMADFSGVQYDVLTLRAGMGSDLLMAAGKAGSLYPYRSVVMRLDTALNVIWSRDILSGVGGFTGYSSYVSKVIPDSDGNVFVGGTCYYEYVTTGIPLAEFYILKLSRTNGSVIWSRRYPVSMSDWGDLNDLELMADGDLVSCGYVTPHDAAGFRGCIYRYAPDGMERWHRYYRFLTNPDAFNQLMDVEPTTDGGFVLTGSTRLSFQFPTVLWLLRLDEHGCVEPGCQSIGVDEVLIGLPEDALRCGPVPTNDLLSVHMKLPETFDPLGNMRLVITDLKGSEVHVEQMDARRTQQAVIRVDSWGSGTYVVHLADDGRLLASRKIVVQ